MSINPNINKQVKSIIEQVVFLITSKEDYENAAKIMIENNLELSTLVNHTYKLKEKDIAILADKIIMSK
ncbi:hypothetical protein ACH5BK_09055 [Arcobacter sp. YIC-80]|uniref:hypothetical protein n=1 Tax=Arcobacter sp. YIC-80 TaxID=3376683 RepID=UPI00384B41D5